MIHLIVTSIRQAKFGTRKEAQQDLYDVHPQFVEPIPGIARYVQTLTPDRYSDREAFDWLAEVWSPDVVQTLGVVTSEQNAYADEDVMTRAEFSPPPTRPTRGLLFCRDNVVIDGPNTRFKLLHFVRRFPGTGKEAFAEKLAAHAPRVSGLPGARRYVQCIGFWPMMLALPMLIYDSAEMIWFDDHDAITAAMRSEHYRTVYRPSLNSFTHHQDTVAYGAEEFERINRLDGMQSTG